MSPSTVASIDSEQGLHLRPLDWPTIARLNIENEGDASIVPYLQRYATRLRDGTALGFVLTTSDGTPVSFLWVAPMNGYECRELSTTLTERPENAVAIFDCWTPEQYRGRRHYGAGLRRAVEMCLAEGKDPWIFCSPENSASAHGIEAAGFEYRYSLKSIKVVGKNTLRRM